MQMNFSSGIKQGEYSIIPQGTIVKAVTELQYPDIPRTNIHNAVWISKNNPTNKYLKVKLFIKDQPYKGRYIYEYIGVKGSDAFVSMGVKKIESLLNSSLDIPFGDTSDEAVSKRKISDYSELSGLHCYLKIIVKKASSSYNFDSNGCIFISRDAYENERKNLSEFDDVPF